MLRRLTRILGSLLLALVLLVLPVRADDLDAQPVVSTPSTSVPAPTDVPSGESAPAAEPASAVETPPPDAPVRNNIFGLNVARLMQERYIWAASDLVNANGGDWGYITVVWTADDRDDPRADLNLQVFLDRCAYFHVQPIIRVATRFNVRSEDWDRPTPDEPAKWRAFFERATWPTRRVWVIVGNEPNLGREWGGFVDAGDYARYLDRFLDVFEGSERFKIVNAPLDASNTTALPKMQDAYEFLAEMQAAVPDVFERLGAWASNPYRVISGGDDLRYTHRAYEAELEAIGRDLPVLIAEAGHLETGDEQEIARFYREAFVDWLADPRVVAVTPLFWHPDRGEYWMFELDRRGAMIYRSPTYEMLRTLPRVPGSPHYAPTLANVPRPPRPPEDDLAISARQPESTSSPMREARARAGTSPGRPAGTAPDQADAPIVEEPEDATAARSIGSPSGAPGGVGASVQSEDQPTFRPRGVTTAEPAETGPTGNGETPSGTGTSRESAPGRIAGVASAGTATEMLRVVGTDSLGAQVRSGPTQAATPVALVSDGAQLVATGAAQVADGIAWRPVRTVDGVDGWIAAELVAPASAQPGPVPPETAGPSGASPASAPPRSATTDPTEPEPTTPGPDEPDADAVE